MTKKTKATPKTKTPRPQPTTDATPTTSARFKKLVAGTAAEPVVAPEAAPAETAAEPAADAPTPAPAKPERARKAKPTPAPTPASEPAAPLSATSLKTIAAAYIAHLQATGKSLSTIASYAADLEVAVEYFGAARDATTLTPDDITAFDASTVVTHKKNGAARAKPTILKTRRVLRLALTWAAATGTLAAAPYATKVAG